jgi:hypothetical protein
MRPLVSLLRTLNSISFEPKEIAIANRTEASRRFIFHSPTRRSCDIQPCLSTAPCEIIDLGPVLRPERQFMQEKFFVF